MSTDLEALIASALARALESIESADGSDALRRVTAELTGKKGPLGELRARLGGVGDIEEKRRIGKALADATAVMEQALDDKMRAVLDREMRDRVAAERMDLTELLTSPRRAKTRSRPRSCTSSRSAISTRSSRARVTRAAR